MNKELFEYGGYHFIPERKLIGAEAELYAISKKICQDRELGFCEEGYAYPSKFPYSHAAFMYASTDKECDLYRCVENGKLYIPCHHDQQKNQEKNKDKIFLGLEILTLLEFMIPKQRIKGPHKCYSAIDYNHNLPMFHNQ